MKLQPSISPAGCTRRASFQAIAVMLLSQLWGCQRKKQQPAIPVGATVLAVGDSITHGTGASAGQDWPRLLADRTGWQIVNAGIPGDTAQNARTRLGDLLAQHQPSLVIVELGRNDFLRRRSGNDVKDDLRDIIRQVRANGAQVVLVAVPAPSLLGAVASRLTDAPLYKELAAEENVVLVETVIASVLSDKDLRADPIHPNAQGYRQMVGELYRSLQKSGIVAN